MEEFQRSTAVHGETYQLINEDRHGFRLAPPPGAQFDDPFPWVYRHICDWQTLRRQRLLQTTHSSGASSAPKTEYGVYQDQQGRLWIDGSWQKPTVVAARTIEMSVSRLRCRRIEARRFTRLPFAWTVGLWLDRHEQGDNHHHMLRRYESLFVYLGYADFADSDGSPEGLALMRPLNLCRDQKTTKAVRVV